MKKIISIILIVLAFIILPIVNTAETQAISYDMTLIFDDVTVEPGETFDYALMIKDNISTLNNLTISNCVTLFADNGFKLNGIKAGPLAAGAEVRVLDDNSTVQISNAGISGNGCLLYFNVTAANLADTSYQFKATISDKSTAGPYCIIYSGKGNVSISKLVETPVTYTVKYNANGGKKAPSAQTKTKDMELSLSKSIPVRSGYIFQGWSTSKSGSKVNYKAGAKYTDNKSITLYAVWKKAKTYKITFNANGGKNAPSVQIKTKGIVLKLTTKVPTRKGYIFQGWSTSKNSKKVVYKAGAQYKADKSVTLYAVWKKK